MPRREHPKVAPVVQLRKRELSSAHREHLRATSGLSDETIELAGLYTEGPGSEILRLLNWSGKRWKNGAALIFPYSVPGREGAIFCRVRPDLPHKNRKGEVRKYLQPVDVGIAPYLPPRGVRDGRLRELSLPLLFCEGEKKTLLLDQLGYAVIGGSGVDCFHDPLARQAGDGFRLHPLTLEHAAIAGRRCVILFDSDAHENDQVMRAARRLAGVLKVAGASETLFCCPPAGQDKRLGIDDFFVLRGAGDEAVRDIDALVRTARALEPIDPEEPLERLRNLRALREAPIDSDLRLPEGYTILTDGALWAQTDGEESSARVVERSTILLRRVLRDVHTSEHRAEVAFRSGGHWTTAVVDRKAIVDTRTAVAELGPVGAPIDSTTAAEVVKWLRALEHVNETRLERTACVSQCGWLTEGGERVFIFGNEVIRREGSKGPEVAFDARGGRERVVRALRTEGDRDAHFAAIRRAFGADRVVATVICGALAAPLIEAIGAQSFAIHLHGDSSRGKTTMLKVAASIYGDPRSELWVAPWNSTAVGMELRAACLSDLPLCIDEAGQVDAETLQEALYLLINGQGRVRGGRYGGLRELPSWRTVVLSTGEKLAADDRAATGAQVRVVQPYVSGFGQFGASDIDELRAAVELHFGHVGREWLQSLAGITDWGPYRVAFRETVKFYQGKIASTSLVARQAIYFGVLAFVERMAAEVLEIGDPKGRTMESWFADSGGGRHEIVPIAERALEAVRAWRQSRPWEFRRLTLDIAGELEPAGGDGRSEIAAYLSDDAISFLPPGLRARLEHDGMSYETVTRAWRDRGWLLVHAEGSRCTRKIRVLGSSVRVVSLRRDVFDGCAQLDISEANGASVQAPVPT